MSVSASGSASGSGRSGSDGEFSFECPSSPPAAEVVSGAAAAVLLGTVSEATGAGVGVVGTAKDARGCAVLSTGESTRGAVPGRPSVGKNKSHREMHLI